MSRFQSLYHEKNVMLTCNMSYDRPKQMCPRTQIRVLNLLWCADQYALPRVSDGSDHRACCSDRGVPRRCLEWCRGEPVNNKMCVLSYSKSILACFHELRGTREVAAANTRSRFINDFYRFPDKLPGPPVNVRVENTDAHTVTVKWDPPTKNPQTVEVYR